MAGVCRVENHVKVLYCINLVTLWSVIFCFAYVYFCLAPKIERLEELNGETYRYKTILPKNHKLVRPPMTPSSYETPTRTRRNPTIIPYGDKENDPAFYQYTLKDLLKIEKEKEKAGKMPKRKRIKLKITFNDTKRPPLVSEVENPTVVDLPSPEEDIAFDKEAWILLPLHSKIEMNYLKEFCFTIHDFCAESNDIFPSTISVETSATAIPNATVLNESGANSNTNQSFEKSTKDVNISVNLNEDNGANLFYYLTNSSARESIHPNNSGNVTIIGTIEPSEESCYIHQFGKHLEVGYRKTFYGAWMRDPKPRSEADNYKRWVVEHFSGIILLEYVSESDLYKPELNPVKTYTLPYMYEGTGHVIYNGAFYYHRMSTPNVVRYNLHTNRTKEITIEGASYKGYSLYSDNEVTYLDLSVDENGLWVIYRHVTEPKALHVTRLNPRSLKIIKTWNLTEIDTVNVGNAWITCGILYMVKSSRHINTTLHYAYDLYKHQYAPMNDIEWTNPYGNANMITYNAFDRKIYIYDMGHLILLPVALTYSVD